MTCPNIMIPLVVCINGRRLLPAPSENSQNSFKRGVGFGVHGFELSGKNNHGGIIVNHRPENAQVSQLYRIPSDTSSTELERLTYFDIGSGRIIRSLTPILGEDWRGRLRAGGALMVMDLTGNENFQLWYEVPPDFDLKAC